MKEENVQDKDVENKDPIVLGNKKIEQLSKQPILESFVRKSEDGKWVVHKTMITDIKPVSYFEKVLEAE